MSSEAALYVAEPPEVVITPAGMVHLSYNSGVARFERVFQVDDWEAFLRTCLAKVAEWRVDPN